MSEMKGVQGYREVIHWPIDEDRHFIGGHGFAPLTGRRGKGSTWMPVPAPLDLITPPRSTR